MLTLSMIISMITVTAGSDSTQAANENRTLTAESAKAGLTAAADDSLADLPAADDSLADLTAAADDSLADLTAAGNDSLAGPNGTEDDPSGDDPAPYFISHSVVIGGQIALRFKMNLSMLSDEELAAGYMTFKVNDVTRTVTVANAENLGNGEYLFTCPVNVLQFAEKIKAQFYYGDGKSVENNYAVSDYVDEVFCNGYFNPEDWQVLKALNDYCHYAQIYLTKVHNIPKNKYMNIDSCFTDEFDYDNILEELSELEPLRVEDTGEKKVTVDMRLSLDSETVLTVRIHIPEDCENFECIGHFDGEPFFMEDTGYGDYIVRITGLSPLDYSKEILINAPDINIYTSVLGYIKAMLLSDPDDLDMVNAMAAMYNYYREIGIFAQSHPWLLD